MTGSSGTGTRRMQEAFAARPRHVGRPYPRGRHPRAARVTDDAPWHRGGPVAAAARDNPHPKSDRLPSYSPQLNPGERFWRELRPRATHDRSLDALADLRGPPRASPGYSQAVRGRVRATAEGRPKRKATR